MRSYVSRLLLLPFLALLAFSGCSQENSPPVNAGLPPGNHSQTISTGGTLREYILHVPLGYDGSKALPLLFVLHGYGGTAGSIMTNTVMNEKADQENFFVAYLQGTVSLAGGRGWNSGLTPGLGINVDDVAFVRDLVEQLKGQVLVDTHRVYAAGLSNGGFMCHRLATELPDILAGVAVVAGTIGSSPDDGATFYTIPEAKGPIPVIMIHGEQDPNIKYYGGEGGGQGQLYVKSAAEAVAYWTAADGCTGAPGTSTSADGNILTEDHAACAAGSEVTLVTIVNGVHEWPSVSGHTGFSANDAIWEFFARHSQ